MKPIKTITECGLILCAAACFLFFPADTASGIQTGLRVCANSILPALFPFFVLSEYWIRRGYAEQLSHIAAPLTRRLFHLPGAASSALVLGCIGGYPVGARTAANLYQKKQLSQEEAENLLLFCNNAGPGFVIGIVGSGVLGSVSLGIIQYLIHITAAIIIGILLRPKNKRSRADNNPSLIQETAPVALTEAIRYGGNTAVQVCTFVLFFSVTNACLLRIIHDVCGYSKWQPLVSGILELAGGANSLRIAPWSIYAKWIASAFFLGWSGICVMAQSTSFLQASGLRARRLYAGKLLHGTISSILAVLPAPLVPLYLQCTTFPPTSPTSALLETSFLLLLICLVFQLLKESSGNVGTHQI